GGDANCPSPRGRGGAPSSTHGEHATRRQPGPARPSAAGAPIPPSGRLILAPARLGLPAAFRRPASPRPPARPDKPRGVRSRVINSGASNCSIAMPDAFTIAILGATGAVGREMLEVLHQRRFPTSQIRALGSSRSVGRRLAFAQEEIGVREATPEAFKGVDVALFAAGAGPAREFAPAAVEAGAIVVDNSSAFRMDPEVPLVIPEINGELLPQRDRR